MKSNFTEEEKTFIKENVIGLSSEQLTYLVNQKFHKNITITQMRNYKKTHKLRSEINTTFKKNQVPHNKKKIGSEFISTDGYTYIKVAEPRVWIQKQRHIYEQNYGKIPKGYSVVFLDQDKTNFDIDNLILVSNKDKLTAKNKHLIFEDKELTKTGLLIAKLINKRKEKICQKK